MEILELRRALGVAIDALARAAWQSEPIDEEDAQLLLERMGALVERPATAADVEAADHMIAVGDPMQQLTVDAIRCRDLALPPTPSRDRPQLSSVTPFPG